MKRLHSVFRFRKWGLKIRLMLQRSRLRRCYYCGPEQSKQLKCGLAVITYNRLDYLKACIGSLDRCQWGQAQVRLIVDDGSMQPGYDGFLAECSAKGIVVIRNTHNSGVAVTKNQALKGLIEKGCDHLFLLEDDILMKSSQTLHQYIAYAKRAGLQHLNFALHGELNLNQEMFYLKAEQHLLCYPHLTGAFNYYTREAIEKIGYMDENFHNALEHVEHTYRLAAAGYTLPFWHFADHPLNRDFFEEQPQALKKSIIRQGDWEKNFERAKSYWISKHGGWLPPRPNG